MKTREVFTFKKGDRFSLDYIYSIQGLGGGDWWEKTGEDTALKDIDLGEALVCVRDIKITIVVETPTEAPPAGA